MADSRHIEIRFICHSSARHKLISFKFCILVQTQRQQKTTNKNFFFQKPNMADGHHSEYDKIAHFINETSMKY